MHLWKIASFFGLVTLVVTTLFTCTVVGQESIPVSDLTMVINETGAVHFKIIQTLPTNRDGFTTYHFELQKQYRPENITAYDFTTGKPLGLNRKELETVDTYDVNFDRPYFNGYTFVVEYDNHNRIVDEGAGIYSIGMRPGVDINKVDRISTVVLPEKNFTYMDYNHALDKPVSVEDVGGRKTIQFRNTSSAPADYAWEIRFRAVGIKDEVRTPKSGAPIAVPGMTIFTSLFALAMVARLVKK